MKNAKGLLLSAYFLLCLVLGGASNGGFVANFALQLSGLLLALAMFVTAPKRPVSRGERMLGWLVLFLGAIVVLQFVPLPLAIWTNLPGREDITAELALLGVAPAATFLSLSIHDTLAAITWLLPAACIALALSCLEEIPAIGIVIALAAGTAVAILLGLVQFIGGPDSPAYLYDITNRGLMVGVFANANHMATLLLAAMPFLTAAIQAQVVTRESVRRELLLIWVAIVGFMVLAIILVGSLTGYALILPVLTLCCMILFPRARKKLLAALLLAFASGAGLLALTDEGANVFSQEDALSERGRQIIHATTIEATLEYWPAGTGLGTFRDVYDDYEDPDAVDNVFVNHAHSDYLEILLELGLPGALGMLAFLAWWFSCLRPVCSGRTSDPFAQAAAIASGTILLHSAWDYPLRTAALSTLFAFCCVVLARGKLGISDKGAAREKTGRT